MRKDKTLSFSRLVCSAPAVQGAFASHPPTRLWWKVILLLHGKPTNPELSLAEKTECIADGFKFYAALYRALAVVFVLLSPLLLGLNAAEEHTTYWAGASLLGGVYLWGVSGLGYAGARAYAVTHDSGRVALLAFMVMIVAFLSLFVAALSIVAQQHSWLATAPNLAAVSALFVLGVGSYLIEIVYLATEADERRNPDP